MNPQIAPEGPPEPTSSASPPFPWRELVLQWLSIWAVVLAVASATYSAWDQDWTFDEHGHLHYPRAVIDGNLPSRDGFYSSKTPALLPNILLERLAFRLGLKQPKVIKFVDRLGNVLYLVALLVVVFFFTRRFSDSLTAWMAVLICSLDQNIVAHSGLATVDGPFALACLVALWTMILFADDPKLKTTLLLGAGFGFALTVKFTGLYLVPAFASLAFWQLGGGMSWRHFFRRLGWLAVAGLAACLFISATYFFRDFGWEFGAHQYWTPLFKRLSEWIGWMRLPLPGEYFLGADRVASIERGKFNVIILNRWYDWGVWYYFIVLWFLKNPLGLITGTAVAGWLGIKSRAFRQPGMRLLFAQWLLYFVYFSFLFHTQVGYRYVLMLAPLTWVFVAVGAKDWWKKPAGTYAVIAGVFLCLFEIAPYFGHPIAFSNSLLLPKKEAYRYIADSNLYWNEYNSQLPELIREHGLAQVAVNPVHILPGYNVFDGNMLNGVFWNFEQHRWVRDHLRPVDHIRHVLFVYDVNEEEFGRFLDDKRTFAGLTRVYPCVGNPMRSAGLALSDPTVRYLCVDALETSDLSVRAFTGSARIGAVNGEGRCQNDQVHGAQEVWFRLKMGRHVFCIVDANSFSAQFDVRRGTGGILAFEP